MKTSARRIVLALPLALAAASFLPLAEAWSPAPVQEPAYEEHEESPLGEAMEHMNAGLRKANRALKAGDAAAALDGLGEFQTHVIAAKAQTPPMIESVAENDRAEFLAGYRKLLIDVLRVSCDVEQALVEGRLDDARVVFSEKLRPMEGEGHDRYAEE